jgi:hypothetical protein
MLAADRAVLILYKRNGKPRRGSGLRVADRFVLTADHCANGSDHLVVVGGARYPATVLVRSENVDIDAAVLVSPTLPPVQPLACALLNRDVSTYLEGCQALGFPVWKGSPEQPLLAQAGGYVPTAEGLNPHTALGEVRPMSFKITDPEARGRPVLKGDLDQGGSPWAGMSGAVVVTTSNLVIGIVRSHTLAEGGSSLNVTPLEAIRSLSDDAASLFWQGLGVANPRDLPILPSLDPTATRLRRILDLEASKVLYREASIALQVQIVLAEFRGEFR